VDFAVGVERVDLSDVGLKMLLGKVADVDGGGSVSGELVGCGATDA